MTIQSVKDLEKIKKYLEDFLKSNDIVQLDIWPMIQFMAISKCHPFTFDQIKEFTELG